MSRDIYFRNDVYSIGLTHSLQVRELLFGIRPVLGCQAWEAFTLQPKSCIGLVPVVFEKLRETVIIQMYLKLVYFVKRQYLYILLQIVHGKEFPGNIQHKSPIGKLGKIACSAFRERTLMIG